MHTNSGHEVIFSEYDSSYWSLSESGCATSVLCAVIHAEGEDTVRRPYLGHLVLGTEADNSHISKVL